MRIPEPLFFFSPGWHASSVVCHRVRGGISWVEGGLVLSARVREQGLQLPYSSNDPLSAYPIWWASRSFLVSSRITEYLNTPPILPTPFSRMKVIKSHSFSFPILLRLRFFLQSEQVTSHQYSVHLYLPHTHHFSLSDHDLFHNGLPRLSY